MTAKLSRISRFVQDVCCELCEAHRRPRAVQRPLVIWLVHRAIPTTLKPIGLTQPNERLHSPIISNIHPTHAFATDLESLFEISAHWSSIVPRANCVSSAVFKSFFFLCDWEILTVLDSFVAHRVVETEHNRSQSTDSGSRAISAHSYLNPDCLLWKKRQMTYSARDTTNRGMAISSA